MSTALHGRRYDIRVQTQPALYGEHAVMRILPQQMKILTIEDLGLDGPVARIYRRLLDTPAGMVLIVGPTGSGKTTTLYAGLQILARDASRKVVTVEDPVEYAIEGIQQSAVRPELGFGFSSAMRAFVRQDPDVILVGEIRDEETALEAIRASQTGHLVLSTLHCNDSVDAVQRLRDLGMHLNSLASELLAVLAQRLAKRNCAHCRAAAVPPQDLAEEVFPDGIPADFCCFRGGGCARCHGLGGFGRIAVAEMLSSGPELRHAISRGATLDELRSVALASGLEPMREHLLRLVHDGTVPFTELRALLPPERIGPEGRHLRQA
jgi:type IV pilus assembly protein PilB